MLSPIESQNALLKMFRRKQIAHLDDMFHLLDTRSRMSVFRRLKALGYLSSYTDAGRYYTLPNIPQFNLHGLWFCQEVGFSRAGTLKSTATDIVTASEAGMTPTELFHLLRLKVPNSLHNTLHGLVKGRQLRRHRLKNLALYTSIDSNIAQKQIAARWQRIKGPQVTAAFSTEATTAVLVEALRAGKVLPSPFMVSKRLCAQGMVITGDQVQEIFFKHGLTAKKKTAEQP